MLVFQGIDRLLIVKLSIFCRGFLEKLISFDVSWLCLHTTVWSLRLDNRQSAVAFRQDRRSVGEGTYVSVAFGNVSSIDRDCYSRNLAVFLL